MADRVKTVVEVRPQVWRAFKALCTERGDTVQGRIGQLVAGDVAAGMRRRSKALDRERERAQADAVQE